MAVDRARFKAWAKTQTFEFDRELKVWQAATDAAIERLPCMYVWSAARPSNDCFKESRELSEWEWCPRCAVLRELKGEP